MIYADAIDPYTDLTQTERIHYRMLAYKALSRPDDLTEEDREEWEWVKRYLSDVDEQPTKDARS